MNRSFRGAWEPFFFNPIDGGARVKVHYKCHGELYLTERSSADTDEAVDFE